MMQDEKMNVEDVDALLKKTLQLSEEDIRGDAAEKHKSTIKFVLCAVICLLEILVFFALKGWEGIGANTPIFVGLAGFFGGYCFKDGWVQIWKWWNYS